MRLSILSVLMLSLIAIVKAQTPSPGGSGGSGSGACRCPNCSDGCCKGTCSGGAGSGGGASPAPQSQAQTQQQTTTAPSSGGKKKGGGGGGGGGCFIGDDTVVTNMGTMKMSELVGKKDIKVLTHNSKTDKFEMSPITYWMHANPNQRHKFFILSTESGHKLHITKFHLIYETSCDGVSRTVFAKNVKPGNCLYVQNDGDGKLTESKVVAIEEVEKIGVYAPITENDNIVVNDILASCYAEYEDVEMQKLLISFMMWAKNCFEFVLPESFVDAIYSTPFTTFVDIPQFFFSFMDLSKVFIR